MKIQKSSEDYLEAMLMLKEKHGYIRSVDIAAQLGRDKHEGQILVAFAAETDDLIENAQKKLAKKNADMVVANDVTMPGAGFGVNTNCVTLITREDQRSLPLMSKRELADRILSRVLALREA